MGLALVFCDPLLQCTLYIYEIAPPEILGAFIQIGGTTIVVGIVIML